MQKIVPAFVSICYEDLGKPPHQLDGQDMHGAFEHLLPGWLQRRPPPTWHRCSAWWTLEEGTSLQPLGPRPAVVDPRRVRGDRADRTPPPRPPPQAGDGRP